jgi:hypothetical protein
LYTVGCDDAEIQNDNTLYSALIAFNVFQIAARIHQGDHVVLQDCYLKKLTNKHLRLIKPALKFRATIPVIKGRLKQKHMKSK